MYSAKGDFYAQICVFYPINGQKLPLAITKNQPSFSLLSWRALEGETVENLVKDTKKKIREFTDVSIRREVMSTE